MRKLTRDLWITALCMLKIFQLNSTHINKWPRSLENVGQSDMWVFQETKTLVNPKSLRLLSLATKIKQKELFSSLMVNIYQLKLSVIKIKMSLQLCSKVNGCCKSNQTATLIKWMSMFRKSKFVQAVNKKAVMIYVKVTGKPGHLLWWTKFLLM